MSSPPAPQPPLSVPTFVRSLSSENWPNMWRPQLAGLSGLSPSTLGGALEPTPRGAPPFVPLCLFPVPAPACNRGEGDGANTPARSSCLDFSHFPTGGAGGFVSPFINQAGAYVPGVSGGNPTTSYFDLTTADLLVRRPSFFLSRFARTRGVVDQSRGPPRSLRIPIHRDLGGVCAQVPRSLPPPPRRPQRMGTATTWRLSPSRTSSAR